MHNLIKIAFFILMAAAPLSVEGQVINRVVAIVNDEVITEQDVQQLISVLYAQYVQEYKGDELLKKMEEVKRDVLVQMIEDKLILSRAKELDIRVTEQEISDKLEYIKSSFQSEKDFFDTLKTQGITVSDLKKRYSDQIMMKKVLDLEVRPGVSVLPSEISGYYEGHREDFRLSERCWVRHILIKAEDDVGFELAKVEAQGICDKIKEGQDFAELAKAYSQGPNKENGGDMGYIARGEMLEELEDAIFSMDKGEYSGPVKSKVGYHIFKVEDIQHSGYLSLDMVQADIKAMILQKRFKERLNEWLGGLRSKAYISIK